MPLSSSRSASRASSWRPKVAGLIIALSVLATVGSPSIVAGQYELEYVAPMDCPISFHGWTLSSVLGHKWTHTSWTRSSYPNPLILNVANYDGDGPFIDDSESWRWLSPTGRFSCRSVVLIPGILVLDDFVGSNWGGTVEPFGESVSETTSDPSQTGGGGDLEVEMWQCWYWQYPNGTRSPYYRCEQLW